MESGQLSSSCFGYLHAELVQYELRRAHYGNARVAALLDAARAELDECRRDAAVAKAVAKRKKREAKAAAAAGGAPVSNEPLALPASLAAYDATQKQEIITSLEKIGIETGARHVER